MFLEYKFRYETAYVWIVTYKSRNIDKNGKFADGNKMHFRASIWVTDEQQICETVFETSFRTATGTPSLHPWHRK